MGERTKEMRKLIHSCLRKVKHPNEESAEHARKVMTHKHKDHRFRAYKCEFCESWHVGKCNNVPRPKLFNFPEGWDCATWDRQGRRG
jgi:hypothetical protein